MTGVIGLGGRGVIEVAGADAATFLDGLLTAPVSGASPTRAAHAALLTPQGKILFDVFVFRLEDRFLLDVPKALVADAVKRLSMYRLRAKVTIADVSASVAVGVVPEGDAPAGALAAAPDPRHAGLGLRVLVPADLPRLDDESAHHARRIALGVPEGGIDFAYGDAFPHDVNLDQLHGVDFKKGCYVGQEVVSRMQHRGLARRRVVKVAADATLAAGTEILAGEKPVGTLGGVAGTAGLALVRLDRAKEAIDAGVALTAGGVPVRLALPDYASFGWPETVVAD